MSLLWSVYGNHHTTCACGFSAEMIESKKSCKWFVYVKKGEHLDEGSAKSVKEAKAMAEASLMGYVCEAEEIV